VIRSLVDGEAWGSVQEKGFRTITSKKEKQGGGPLGYEDVNNTKMRGKGRKSEGRKILSTCESSPAPEAYLNMASEGKDLGGPAKLVRPTARPKFSREKTQRTFASGTNLILPTKTTRHRAECCRNKKKYRGEDLQAGGNSPLDGPPGITEREG